MDEDLGVNYSKEVWIKNVFEVWQKRNVAVQAKLEEVWSVCIVFYLCTVNYGSCYSDIKVFFRFCLQYGHAVELERISLLLALGNFKEAEAAAFK